MGNRFKKTYKICQNENIKVDYENEQDGFWFIFYRKNRNQEQIKIEDTIQAFYKNNNDTIAYGSELSESEQIVLGEIRKEPRITIKQLSELTKRGERTIQRILNKLKDKNIIKRMDGKKGYWKIV